MNDLPGARGQGRRLLTALDDLGNIAERAAQAWAGRLTIRQGYDITVMLGSALDRLGAVAADLSRYRLTDQAGLADGPAADAVSEIGQASRQIMGGRAALIIPDEELPWTSIGYSEPVSGYRVRRGGPPGGDPVRDGEGVRAAHLMLLAANIAAGSSSGLHGESDDRDEIVFHLMSALDGLGLAIPNLARGAPDPPFLSALASAAACLDQAFGHLREYLIFSAAAATGLDIGELGENMRRGIQLRAERERASAAAGGRSAVGLAAASFPGSPGDATAASPEPETSGRPSSAAWRRSHGRPARPPRGNR